MDVERIGIVLDATGAQREIRLTVDELKRLANGGKEAQVALRQLTPPAAVVELQKTANVIQQVRNAQSGATMSADKLRGAFTTLAVASGALPGPIGRVASILGSFALGSGVMVGVLAGVAALGFAWDKLTEKSEKLRQSYERQLDVLRKLKREQDLGVLGEAGEATGVGRARLDQISSAMQATNRLMKSGQITGPAFAELATRRAALIEEYQALEPLVRAGEREIARIKKEEAERAAEEAKQQAAARVRGVAEAEQKALRAFLFGVGQQEFFSGGFLGGAGRGGDPTGGLFGRASDTVAAQNTARFTEDQGNTLQFVILPALREQLDLMKRTAEEAEKAAEAQRKRADDMVISGAVGFGTSALSRMGGVFGAIGQGLSGGFAGISGGPVGIAFGAINGLMSGILGLGTSAKQQREEMERLERQYESFTDSIKEQLGIMSPLEARSRAASRQFADMRQALEDANFEISALEMQSLAVIEMRLAEHRGETAQKTGELNSLEKQYLEFLKQQEQQRINDIAQESAVLRLRINGRNEEADAMQRQLDAQQELRAAIDAGASAAEQFAIKERNRLKEILIAIEATEKKIAGLTATIGGLQSFRNSLLLSPDAGLSPTQQLAESRRQYEEILLKALSGDQSAAGQLPAAAQTLLQFSRAMNASGPAFQSDLQQILADNAEVIQRFEAMKSVEEQMLEQLRKIAEDTGVLSGRAANPSTESPDRPLGSIMLDGFQAMDQRLVALTQRVEEQTQVNRTGFDGFLTGNLN